MRCSGASATSAGVATSEVERASVVCGRSSLVSANGTPGTTATLFLDTYRSAYHNYPAALPGCKYLVLVAMQRERHGART